MTTFKSLKPYRVTFTQTIRFSSKVMATSPAKAAAIIQNSHELLDPRHTGFLLEVENCNTSGWDTKEILP